MATTKKAAASKKELTIVAIYKFKSNGKLNGTRCTLVRNGEGEEYQVWTHSNGCSSSCTCEGFTKWHRKCYHIKFAEVRQAVAAPAPVVVAEPVATTVASVETPAVVETVSTAQPVVETTATEIVVKQPAASGRKMSSVEASMPAWMLTGRSNNGTFTGRGARKAS